MTSAPIEFSEDATALYRLYDTDGRLLYVGISANPRARFAQHATDKPWWPTVAKRSVEWLESRAEAVEAEAAAIRTERPSCNIAMPYSVSANEGAPRAVRAPGSSDRHIRNSISLRFPEEARAWLLDHAGETGRAVNAVLQQALSEYRQKHDPDPKENQR